MNPSSKITDAEYKIMQAVWQLGTATSAQIIQEIEQTESWSPKTVYTLIGRLVEKGALEISRTQGRTHWYTAAVTREDYRLFASRTLLERLYDNSLKNMVACFIKDRQITKEEIRQLQQLLDEEPTDE